MNTKKLLTLVLAAQMLVTSFAACSKDNGTETQGTANTPATGDHAVAETNTPETNAPETEAPETELNRLSVSDNLPEINFNGRDFRFMSQDKDAYQVFSEDTSGIGVDAEIYARNKRVEDRFGVKISYLSSSILTQDMICVYTRVGEHVVEAVVHTQEGANTPSIYFSWENWNDIPYLNYDQPWWNKEAIDNYTFGGYTFNLSSDLSLSSMELAWCLPVNMDLMEEWGYSSEELYKLVLDGEWTLDKMIEITADKWDDKNGDGQKDAGDKFGYGSPVNLQVSHVDGGIGFIGGNDLPWVTALGENVMEKDPEHYDFYKITIDTEKLHGALETLVNFHHNNVGVTLDAGDQTFVDGNVGIYTGKFDMFRRYNSQIGFTTGVLPLPKYDAAQKEYRTQPDMIFSMFGTPITLPVEDREMVGVIMEALSAESWKTVMPAYYEESLKGRYSSDATMAEVVEIIANGREFDYSGSCAQSFPGDGKLPCTFSALIAKNNTDLASTIAEHRDHIERSLSELMIFYNLIEYERWGDMSENVQLIARFGEPRYVDQ